MLEAGTKAPSFHLSSLSGIGSSADEILKQGPALFAFFKTSCPVCQLTLPYLERLAAGSSLQIVGISQDDLKATESFNQRAGVTFRTLLDKSKEGYPASNAFEITSVPTLFLVEPDGTISTSFSGFSKRGLEALGERAGIKPFRPQEDVPEFKAG